MAKMSSKYGVVELNNVAGVRTGQVITQYTMASGVDELENGMLVVVDHYKGEIKKPTNHQADATTVYLHASVEKLYDGEGRKEFVCKKGEFLPRLYKLHVGDTFETNCVEYDGNINTLIQAINETQGWGHTHNSGRIKLEQANTNVAAGGVVLKALSAVTLPNGEQGIKFRVVKA